jgi:hypothetical protein
MSTCAHCGIVRVHIALFFQGTIEFRLLYTTFRPSALNYLYKTHNFNYERKNDKFKINLS